jgi:hypothetical protein
MLSYDRHPNGRYDVETDVIVWCNDLEFIYRPSSGCFSDVACKCKSIKKLTLHLFGWQADLPADVHQYTERLRGLPPFAAGAEQAGLSASLRSAPEATSSGRVPILPVPGELHTTLSPNTRKIIIPLRCVSEMRISLLQTVGLSARSWSPCN